MSALALAPATPATPSPLTIPHDEETERAVLSACFFDAQVLPLVRAIIAPADFYRTAHGKIFATIGTLADEGATPDAVTVVARLRRDGALASVGDVDYVSSLIDDVLTARHATQHAQVLRELAQRRAVMAVARDAIHAAAHGTTAQAVAQRLSSQLLPIAVDTAERRGYLRIDAWSVLDEIEKRGKGEAITYTTGISAIDAETCGFSPGELVLFCGPPKVGKSALVHSIARFNGLAGRGVGIMSAEMSAASLTERHLNAMSGVPVGVTRSGRLQAWQWERITEASRQLTAAPIWIDDAIGPTLDDVYTRGVALKAQHPEVGLIVVDYLQLVQHRMHGRRGDEELQEISKGLKALAKATQCVLLVPCGMNSKDVVKRPQKRGTVEDITGGTGPLKDADFACVMYRPNMYYAEAPPVLELEFSLCRRTATFTAVVEWHGDTMSLGGAARPVDSAPVQGDAFADREVA